MARRMSRRRLFEGLAGLPFATAFPRGASAQAQPKMRVRPGDPANKGLAGAPADAIAAAKDTAMNPAVVDAFALALSGAWGQPAYPGVPGHGPDAAAARSEFEAVDQSMNAIRKLLPNVASYVWETDFSQPNWQEAFWGGNFPRLRAVKDKYDPVGLFFLHHGSEDWSADGFMRVN